MQFFYCGLIIVFLTSIFFTVSSFISVHLIFRLFCGCPYQIVVVWLASWVPFLAWLFGSVGCPYCTGPSSCTRPEWLIDGRWESWAACLLLACCLLVGNVVKLSGLCNVSLHPDINKLVHLTRWKRLCYLARTSYVDEWRYLATSTWSTSGYGTCIYIAPLATAT